MHTEIHAECSYHSFWFCLVVLFCFETGSGYMQLMLTSISRPSCLRFSSVGKYTTMRRGKSRLKKKNKKQGLTIFECHHLMETSEMAECVRSKFSHSQLCPRNHRRKEQRPEDVAGMPAGRANATHSASSRESPSVTSFFL